MEIICLILLLLLLLLLPAQIALYVLFFREKATRRSAMADIDRRYNEVQQRLSAMEAGYDALKTALYQQGETLSALEGKGQTVQEGLHKLEEAVKTLSLDYRQAQAAADHINDFAKGISNIFDYDPMEAIRKQRSSEVR